MQSYAEKITLLAKEFHFISERFLEVISQPKGKAIYFWSTL